MSRATCVSALRPSEPSSGNHSVYQSDEILFCVCHRNFNHLYFNHIKRIHSDISRTLFSADIFLRLLSVTKTVALTRGRGRHLANCSSCCKISLVWLKLFWLKILTTLFICYTKQSNCMCIQVSSISSKITFLTGTQLSYFLDIVEKLCFLCCKQARLSLHASVKVFRAFRPSRRSTAPRSFSLQQKKSCVDCIWISHSPTALHFIPTSVEVEIGHTSVGQTCKDKFNWTREMQL